MYVVDNKMFNKPLKGDEKKNFIAEVDFAKESMAYYWSSRAIIKISNIYKEHKEIKLKTATKSDFGKIKGQKRDKYGRFLYKVDLNYYNGHELQYLLLPDQGYSGYERVLIDMRNNPNKYFKKNKLFGKKPVKQEVDFVFKTFSLYMNEREGLRGIIR